jgi:hypothetical protein
MVLMRLPVQAALLACVVFVVSGGAGCASSQRRSPKNPGVAACGDPCATMSCPGNLRCSWNDQCQPRCDPEVLTPMVRP